jgi:DNA-binding beta-propeller fold protein YncE
LGVLVAAAVFGVVEQRAVAGYPAFVTALGEMSAPWLVLPFLAGASRASRGGVPALGFAVALAAVGGFLAATGDPTGDKHDPAGTLTGGAGYVFLVVVDHLPWFLGAVVSGPLYALLGHRWRVTRSWPLALTATAPVMLEPVLRWGVSSSGILYWGPFAPAAWAEALAGLALTAAAITIDRRGGKRERLGAKPSRGPVRRFAREAGRISWIAIVAGAVIAFCAPPVSPQLYGAGNGAEAMALAADGRTLYVVNESWVYRDARMQGLPTTATPVDTGRMRAATPVDVDPTGNGLVNQAIVTRDDQTLYVLGGPDLVAVHLRTGSRITIRVPGGADRMVLSPDGATLYVSTDDDRIIPVVAATGRLGRPVQLPRSRAKGASPYYLALTRDGKVLYADLQSDYSPPDEIVGVNLVTGKAVPLDYQAEDGHGIALAPDGRTLYLITNGDSYDGDVVPGEHHLIAVSTATGKQVGQPLALSDGPNDLAITPDGRVLFIVSDDTVIRVPLMPATGGLAGQATTVIGLLTNQEEHALAISPDGRNLYVAGEDGVQLVRLN